MCKKMCKQFEQCVRKHPTVFKLIQAFRDEQRSAQVLTTQLLSGTNFEYVRTRKFKDYEAKIKLLVTAYSGENFLSFHKNISKIL